MLGNGTGTNFQASPWTSIGVLTIHTESVDDPQTVDMAVGRDEPAPPPLPSIGVFLSKTCTIPLIHCDFEQIKKTVELQTTQTKVN